MHSISCCSKSSPYLTAIMETVNLVPTKIITSKTESVEMAVNAPTGRPNMFPRFHSKTPIVLDGLKRGMPFKRTSSPSEFQQATRLSSRISDFDSRVTIFEPGSGPSSSSFSSKLKAEDVDDQLVDEPEGSPIRSRKRIKLCSETGVADIEELVHVGTTPSGSRKFVETKGLDNSSPTPKPSPSDSSSKFKSPSKLKSVPQTLKTPHPAPPQWRETYDTIKSMRSRFVAPVDSMGCAQAQTGEAEPRVSLLSRCCLLRKD